MNHVEKQSSYQNLLFLDTKPVQRPMKTRFYFDKRWVKKTGIEDIVKTAWDSECDGSPMLRVASKIKKNVD